MLSYFIVPCKWEKGSRSEKWMWRNNLHLKGIDHRCLTFHLNEEWMEFATALVCQDLSWKSLKDVIAVWRSAAPLCCRHTWLEGQLNWKLFDWRHHSVKHWWSTVSDRSVPDPLPKFPYHCIGQTVAGRINSRYNHILCCAETLCFFTGRTTASEASLTHYNKALPSRQECCSQPLLDCCRLLGRAIQTRGW